MSRTRDVIILCGGKGTRLSSVSLGRQKCILEVNGKPFLTHILDWIEAHKIFKRVFLATGQGSSEILDLFGNSYKGIDLILPAEGNEMEVNKKNIVNVLINDQGKVLLDDKPTLIKDIKRKATDKINSNDKIIFSVLTTKRTKYKFYIEVLDQLKQAGASKISIANPNY